MRMLLEIDLEAGAETFRDTLDESRCMSQEESRDANETEPKGDDKRIIGWDRTGRVGQGGPTGGR